MAPSLHPAIDNGITQGFGSFNGGTLQCKCASDKVVVQVAGDVAFNHACGCSKCWKPQGALFSVVGVVPTEKLKVTEHPEKLKIVDEKAAIQRHACQQCGVHMFGRIVTDHPFKGFDFIHTELSSQKGWQAPQFAAFCSSIIEQGYEPAGMDEVRGRFHSMGLDTYDCLAPGLMDAIAGYTAKKQGTAYDPSKPAGSSTPKPQVAAGSSSAAAARPTPAPAKPAAAAPPPPPPAAKQGGIAGFFSRLFGG